MASGSRPRVHFDILEDSPDSADQLAPFKAKPLTDSAAVLGELDLDDLRNQKFRRDDTLTPDSLADKLASLHLQSASKENVDTQQVAKHEAGQFEWILSVPVGRRSAKDHRGRSPPPSSSNVDGQGKKLYFGCNIVYRRAQSGGNPTGKDTSADIYTLLATPIEQTNAALSQRPQLAEATTKMADNQPIIVEPLASDLRSETPPEYVHVGGHSLDAVERILSIGAERPRSRIEDTFEALDRLEEELEEVNAVTRLGRVLSPETNQSGIYVIDSAVQQKNSPRRTGSAKNTPVKSGSATVRVKSVTRSPSLRKSTSMTFSMEEDKAAPKPTPSKAATVRPASLLPPKLPAKSTKRPTIPSFELPGEAVARKLKEQKEARLSLQIVAEPSPAPIRVRTVKQPTIPTFELPGEAISRRKREAQLTRLKAQEEEERKRREFKARPIRNSIAPGMLPRETISSRARQGKSLAENSGDSNDTAKPPLANKRHSVAATPTTFSRQPLSSTTNSQGNPPPSRGRASLAGSISTLSRATSSSTGSLNNGLSRTGSMSSKNAAANVTGEDMQQQKLRGRHIYARDNSILADRERERREREAAAKAARQEAAERSRELSRQWAERQRLKRLASGGSAASGGVAGESKTIEKGPATAAAF